MISGVAGAEVTVLPVAIENCEERNVLELPQLGDGEAAVLILLVGLVGVVPSLSGPDAAVSPENPGKRKSYQAYRSSTAPVLTSPVELTFLSSRT